MYYLLLITLFLLMTTGVAMAGIPENSVLIEGFARFIEASEKDLKQIITYRGDKATSCGTSCGAQGSFAKWETAPVPNPVPEQVTFAFTGALGRMTGQMELFVNGKVILTFTIPDNITDDYQWEQAKCRLFFDLKVIRNGRQGIFYLTLPGSELKPGEPLELTIRGVPKSGTKRCTFSVYHYNDTLNYHSCNLMISSKLVFHHQSEPLKIYAQPLNDFNASKSKQVVNVRLLNEKDEELRSGRIEMPRLMHSGTVEDATALDTSGLPDGTYKISIVVTENNQEVARKQESLTFIGQRYDAQRAQETWREKNLRNRLTGMLGDYDREPRLPNKRLDIPALIKHLTAISANTYDFLVWHQSSDWEDLQAFLPEAEKIGVNVWVTLVPTVYNPPSKPFEHDYVAWAKAIAELSIKHPNLVAWAIDDFHASPALFTPDYIARVSGVAREINPDLGFFPVIYSGTVRDRPEWIRDFAPGIDGMMYVMGLDAETPSDMEGHLKDARYYLGPNKLLMVNVYAMGTGGHPSAPGTLYLRQALQVSREYADGIRIYCLPKEPDDPLFLVTKELFSKWKK